MQSINALSLAPNVNNWLANSQHPRVLHIFDDACNLINERSEVLSIVTSQIGNGPFNLVIEKDLLFSNYLNADSKISIRKNQLNIADLTIETDDTQLWNPCPDWEILHAKREDIANRLILLSIQNYQPSLHISLLTTFSAAVANTDIPAALATTRQLAGLGQGLTPAGDDFILGAILAAWIIHPLEIASVITKEITNTTAPLTTSLSAAWLRSAGKGQAGILWHNFFNALIFDDLSAIESQMNNLLSIGHTSGADAFAGFIGTLSNMESEKNHVLSKLTH